MTSYDAIVLGLGGVGSAALYHLARRGARAVGIDRFAIGHDRGSSHGQTRIIRQAYFEHPNYVPLVQRSYRLWQELQELSGQQLFHPVGLLQVGPANGEVIRGVRASAEQHDLTIEQLTADEVCQRWPQFRVPDPAMCGIHEPTAGYLEVEACVQAHVDAAVRCGAELIVGEGAREWRVQQGHVTVWTNTQRITADRLIIAAGAWAADMLRDLGLPLHVLRKSLFWFRPRQMPEFGQGFPCFLFETGEGEFYGFPALEPYGLKIAEHTGGQIVSDPLHVSREVNLGDQQRIEAFAAHCIPTLERAITRHAVCLYTMSPDRHFMIDTHPDYANVVFAAGLSGHGFKFTPVLGEALVELALQGATSQPIDFLRWPRRGLND